MPHVIEPPTQTLPPAETPRLRWNAEQYENLLTMGLLPQKGYELIEGDIVEKMPIKNAHGLVVSLLFALFVRFFGFSTLRSQTTLFINSLNMPEPDFVVLSNQNPTLSARGYLQPADVRLVVEVSDATLQTDLTVKARLYARAHIAEYWVLDINNRRLLLHTKPGADGYEHVSEYADNETAAPAFMPSATFAVADILPPLP